EGTLEEGATVSLPESHVTAVAFDLAYCWMLSAAARCMWSNLVELAKVAIYLKAPKLLSSVMQVFANNRTFEKVQELQIFSEACDDKQLCVIGDDMLQRISRSFLVIIGSKHFASFNIDAIEKLLGCNHLAVHNEIEVLYGALGWLACSYDQREVHLLRILATVRFEALPPLATLNMGLQLENLMPKTSDRMNLMSRLAIVDSLTRLQYEKAPRKRVIIIDPQCPYINSQNQLSVISFKHYIQSIDNSYTAFLKRIKDVKEENKEN
ncbi:hypothetical protein KR044_009540, partial [Drosophila immigrans]